ncbi:hypothetical protein B9057_15045 (plasmid) [Aestuarium zhoushanense]|nr:hypothetical protein B9057_15045 [Aestuarium zhoushanense]
MPQDCRISKCSIEAVIEDTLMIKKAKTHLTDPPLYQSAEQPLMSLAQIAGRSLRQNYARLSSGALKGTIGDTLNGVFCSCGHSLNIMLAHRRGTWSETLMVLWAIMKTSGVPIAHNLASVRSGRYGHRESIIKESAS